VLQILCKVCFFSSGITIFLHGHHNPIRAMNKKLVELERLKNTCSAIILFYKIRINQDLPFDFAINSAYQTGDLSGLKYCLKELINISLVALPDSILFELNTYLRKEGLYEITQILKKQEMLINTIIKRGVILSEFEAEVVNDYINTFYNSDTKGEKIATLSAMKQNIG